MELHKPIPVGKSPHLDSWVCLSCTYHNLPLLHKCEMCEADRAHEENLSVDVVKYDCPWCTVEMYSYESVCSTCGHSPDEAPPSKLLEVPVVQEKGKSEPVMVKPIEVVIKKLEGVEEEIKVPSKMESCVINPELEDKPKLKEVKIVVDPKLPEFVENGFDLFGDEEPLEKKTESKKIGIVPFVSSDLLIGEDFFDEEAVRPPPELSISEESHYEGLGISCLYEESPPTPTKKRTSPSFEKKPPSTADEEIYLICDKCSFRNDIHNVLCYTCGYHLLDKIEPEASDKTRPLLESGKPSNLCRMCSYENTVDAKQCEICTYSLTHQKMLLLCPHCTMENHVTSTHCIMCEKELPETGYNKKLFEECPICMGILDISLFDAHVKDCKESQRLLQEIKDEEESLAQQEKCPYCHNPFFRLDFEQHIRKCPNHEDYYKQVAIFGSMSPVQVSCMKFMHENSHKQHFSAKLPLRRRMEKLGYKVEDMEQLYEYIYMRVPLIIHIHISKHMEFFVKDTHYRNQFETGKSSGSTNLVSRKGWETRMFMNRYDQSPHFERVKYGTVNFTNDPRGVNACRSYGNSYLVLNKSVRDRCTLTDQDSSNTCSLIGTFKFCYHILNKLTDAELKATIRASRGEEVCSSVVGSYKEIQIHGPIDFAKDIEKMYVNEIEYNTPQFKQLVEDFTKKFGIPFQVFK